MTLTDLCERLRNWFDVSRHFGDFEIVNGTIDLDYIKEGQFFRLIGTKQNDGIVCVVNGALQYVIGVNGDDVSAYELITVPVADCTFKGAIWELALPMNFLDFYIKANKWEKENEKAINSPYTSEGFGDYSYSKDNDSLKFETHFKSEIARRQKI